MSTFVLAKFRGAGLGSGPSRSTWGRFVVLLTLAVVASSCSGTPDSEQVRQSVDGFSDPSSDIQFALRRIESEIDSCMLNAGHERWVENRVKLSDAALAASVAVAGPPMFRFSDGEVVGYSGDLDGLVEGSSLNGPESSDIPFDEDGPLSLEQQAELDENAAIAVSLLGEDDAESIEFEVPGFGLVGQDLGGCKGGAYDAVIPRSDLPTFLAGEFLLSNLANRLQFGALENLEASQLWTDCMNSEGFEIRSPFEVGSSTFPQLEIARADFSCRQQSDFDSEYQESLDDVIREAPGQIVPALEELERVASSVRAESS